MVHSLKSLDPWGLGNIDSSKRDAVSEALVV